MTVYLSRHEVMYPDNPACTVCGEDVRPPFLYWSCHGPKRPPNGGVIICSGCCRNLRTGLVADLIQVAAIADLQDVYHNVTLVRSSVAKVEAETRAAVEAER